VTPLPATAHPAVVAAMRACLVLDPAARPTAAAVFASLHAALPPGVARDRYVSAAAAEASDGPQQQRLARLRLQARLLLRLARLPL